MSWAVYYEKGSVPQLYIYLHVVMLKAPSSKKYKMFAIQIYITVYLHSVWNIFFLGDPVLPAWKVSAE